MTTGKLDGRTLAMLGIGVAAVLILRFTAFREAAAPVVAPTDSIPMAEQRLARLRQTAAMVPGKQIELKRAEQELAAREKGILAADTAAQAEAHLQDVVRTLAQKNGIDVRGAEEMRVRPLTADYGEVTVTVAFTCGIEQFVNLMAAIANEPELIATRETHIVSGDAKKKTVQVRLGLSAVVPRKLVPEKKGLAAF
jgi:hypothetical protein